MSNVAKVIEQKQEIAASHMAPAGSPMGTALAFLQAGGNIEQLNSILDLQLRWEANEARKAFMDDMTEFKKNPPSILKDKRVSFKTSTGITSYDHATIGEACDKIIAAAAAHGFSHRWVPSQGESGQMVVTCVITHRLGHSEETRLEGPKDVSGGKNAIQSIVSTNTYLQRHSLLMAFGFATKDQPDDDGRGSGSAPQVDPRIADWLSAVESIASVDEYAVRKKELVAAYGGNLSAVPKTLTSAFSAAYKRVKQQ
jgi:hypothetical protein